MYYLTPNYHSDSVLDCLIESSDRFSMEKFTEVEMLLNEQMFLTEAVPLIPIVMVLLGLLVVFSMPDPIEDFLMPDLFVIGGGYDGPALGLIGYLLEWMGWEAGGTTFTEIMQMMTEIAETTTDGFVWNLINALHDEGFITSEQWQQLTNFYNDNTQFFDQYQEYLADPENVPIPDLWTMLGYGLDSKENNGFELNPYTEIIEPYIMEPYVIPTLGGWVDNALDWWENGSWGDLIPSLDSDVIPVGQPRW